MNKYITSRTLPVLLAALLLLLPLSATATTTLADSTENSTPTCAELIEASPYQKRVNRYRKQWEHIIPTYGKLQYAGNMGFLSAGVGWSYGKREQWETDVLLGFLPKNQAKQNKLTMTLKQNFIPWKREIAHGFSLDPLTCGLYFNTVFGEQFWVKEPKRYPKGYYNFSSKVRTHIFIGQRLTYDIEALQRHFARSVTFFYELSTCDLYLVSAFGNSYLKPQDYLSLSFGVKFQWL